MKGTVEKHTKLYSDLLQVSEREPTTVLDSQLEEEGGEGFYFSCYIFGTPLCVIVLVHKENAHQE